MKTNLNLSMETNTTFLPQKALHQQLLLEIENIDIIFSKIDLVLNEDLYSLEKDSYHFVAKMLMQLTNNNRSSKTFAASLFQDVYRTEITSASAGYIAFMFGKSFAKYLIQSDIKNKNTTELQNELKVAVEYFKRLLVEFTKISRVEDVRNIIIACCGADDDLATAIWEALQLSGLEGKIFIENGKQDHYIVEYKEGYVFDLNPFGFMLTNNKKWEAYDCKVLIVDGLVEKISELDHILTKNLETKQPMAIIAHGFSEEVVATLRANQERNILNIQPIRIPPDIDSLNVANDISVVCGTLPISIMKGDMLVFTKYEDLPTVDSIKLQEKQCVFENQNTKAAVSMQIQSLLEKRLNHQLHEEVQNLFDKRMRSLVNNGVTIYLPNMPVNKQDEQRVKIDTTLRQIKTILNNGIVDSKEIASSIKTKTNKNNIESCFYKALLDTFSKKDQRVSPLSAFIGCNLASKTVLLFLMSSGLVEFI